MRSWARTWTAGWVARVAAACADDPGDAGGDPPLACPPAGDARVVASGLTGGTEGITTLDGVVYVGNGDRIVRIDAEGGVTEVATAPGVVGLTTWNGAVWAALWGDDGGALLAWTPGADPVVHPLSAPARPNFLLPTPWGTLLVADDFDPRIYEFTGDDTTVWTEGTPSPNGMGWSPDGGTLYVANTFVNPAPLQAIAVADGAAGAIETLHAFGPGTTPDGLLVTPAGTVLVALNVAGELAAWDGAGITTVAEDLPTVASLAAAPDAPCAVAVTSLFGDAVRVVEVGEPTAP